MILKYSSTDLKPNQYLRRLIVRNGIGYYIGYTDKVRDKSLDTWQNECTYFNKHIQPMYYSKLDSFKEYICNLINKLV